MRGMFFGEERDGRVQGLGGYKTRAVRDPRRTRPAPYETRAVREMGGYKTRAVREMGGCKWRDGRVQDPHPTES